MLPTNQKKYYWILTTITFKFLSILLIRFINNNLTAFVQIIKPVE